MHWSILGNALVTSAMHTTMTAHYMYQHRDTRNINRLLLRVCYHKYSEQQLDMTVMARTVIRAQFWIAIVLTCKSRHADGLGCCGLPSIPISFRLQDLCRRDWYKARQ